MGFESLRNRLRQTTAVHHKRLENSLQLLNGGITRQDYLMVLSRMFGLYLPLEEALTRVDWTGSGINFSERRRCSLIEADLQSLGMDSITIFGLPICIEIPKIENIADGVGVLYVLEGSTLGGKMIMQQIGDQLGISGESGGRFFSSDGKDVAGMWRSYLDSLEHFKDSIEAVDAIELAAIGTFETFYDWFSSDPNS